MSLQTDFIDAVKAFTHLQQQPRIDHLIQYLNKITIHDSLQNYWYVFWLGALLYQEIPEIKNHPKNALLKKRLNEYLRYLDEGYTPTPRASKK